MVKMKKVCVRSIFQYFVLFFILTYSLDTGKKKRKKVIDSDSDADVDEESLQKECVYDRYKLI